MRIGTGLLAIILLLPTLADAQAIHEVAPGSRIRVAMDGATAIEVVFDGVDGERLFVTDAAGAHYGIPLNSVTGVALRRSKASRYAGIGATGGAVMLGFVGGVMSAGLCDQADCSGAFTKGLVGGAAMGALIGAATGAVVGTLVHYWIPLQNDSTSVGLGLGVRVGMDVGLPSGVEGLGYGSCAAPRPDTSLRGSIGHDISPSTWGFVEAGRIDFLDNQCMGQGQSPAADLMEETATATSVLIGAGRRLDSRGRFLVTGAVGLARSTLQRDDPGAVLRGESQTSTSDGVGLHFGTSLQASWPGDEGRSPRLGFSLRADWITNSPMGSVPMTTFGVTLRR